MEEKEPCSGGEQNKKKTSVITIPSYEEVFQSSNSKSTPPSLFVPSQTFSQAFSYLKSSEFYSPPPTTASASSSSFNASQTSQPPESSTFRQVGQNNAAASTSIYAVPPAPAAKSSFPTSNPNPNRNTILVSHRQKGNPLLKHIRNVKWEFADVVCDYLLGQSSCVLYLSLRYHLLHPDYLYYRIRELEKNFKLRVVLCHVDVEDVVKPLLEVTKTALLHECTLLCGWSLEECGRYLETIKVYENKPADLIQGQIDTDYLSRLTHALTTVRHVNKTDVVTLGTTFGSLSHIMDASMEDLARCPGIGERKVKRLYDTFHEPFKHIDSAPSAIPETPAQNHAVFSTADEKQDEQDISKLRKKEPDLTVKSALSAAFARYADKVGKNTIPKEDKGRETCSSKEADIENKLLE